MTKLETSTFQPLDFNEPEGRLIAYEVAGKITAEQAQPVFDRIERANAEGRKLRLYYELHGFPTSEGSVMLEKLRHLGTILKTIERIAIVGDQRWLTAYTVIFDPLTKADLRNFKSDDRAAALAWIQE